MFTISQAAINAVINDIQTDNTDYADEFFANRPEWKDQDENQTVQTDDKQKEEVKI